MHGFLSFIMRRRLNAVLVAAAFGILSLLVAPLSLVSGATLALVALRLGIGEGVKVMLGAVLALAAIAFVARGGEWSGPLQVLLLGLSLGWLPVLVLSWILRQTRSMASALVVAAVIAIAAVVAIHLAVGDASAWWRNLLELTVAEAQRDAVHLPISEADLERALDALAQAMTGLLGAGLLLSLVATLFLARWWQALLYNPGGFRKEFYDLRLDKRVGIVLLLVVGLMLVLKGFWGQLAGDLLVVLLALYSVVGLSLLHGVVAATGSHVGWLFAVYLLLGFLLPQMMILLAAAGFTDSWVNVRERVRIRRAMAGKNDHDTPDDGA